MRINAEVDWRHQAACRDHDPELFFPFPEEHRKRATAVAVCRSCPVVVECREWALDTGLSHGVAGGLAEDERRAYRQWLTTMQAAS